MNRRWNRAVATVNVIIGALALLAVLSLVGLIETVIR